METRSASEELGVDLLLANASSYQDSFLANASGYQKKDKFF